MVRLDGHGAAEAIKANGNRPLGHERHDPGSEGGREAQAGKLGLKVGMSDIVKETLDVTGEDRVDLLPAPCILDLLDEGCASIKYGGTFTSPKLVGGEHAKGVGEILKSLCNDLLNKLSKALLERDRSIRPRCRGVLLVWLSKHDHPGFSPRLGMIPQGEGAVN